MCCFEETTAFHLKKGVFSFLEDMTGLILHNFKERWLLWRTRDKACHSWTYTCQTASKTPRRFQGKVINMHVVWSTGLQGRSRSVGVKLLHEIHDDNSLEGSDRTRYMDETISGRSIKRKCRHNTDWRGCSSFDSGARFHGRFTVPFAWLIEACLSRNTSQLSHGTSELHRQDDVRLASTALCWYVHFGSNVFTTV